MSVKAKDESTPAWLTVGKAARRLGCSVATVELLIRDRKLSVRRVNTWRRVPAREVERLDRAATIPAQP